MFDYITFLTDFGLQDDFVGVCRGVMKRIARDAQILDITHGIAAAGGDPGRARARPLGPVPARRPCTSRSSIPASAASRRAVAIRTGDGPRLRRARQRPADARRRQPTASRGRGASRTRATTSSRSRRRSTPATSSRPSPRTSRPARTSTTSATRSTRRRSSASSCPIAAVADGELIATVLDVDRFGNLGLNVTAEEIDSARRRPRRPGRARLRAHPVLRRRRRDVRRREPRRADPLRGLLRRTGRSRSTAATPQR